MNAVVSLLPGLREARGPLVAGYLWLLVGWLALGASLPDRDTNGTYAHLWATFDAVGTLGLAVAASLAAYLLGSLVQSGLQYVYPHIWRWWISVYYLVKFRRRLRWNDSPLPEKPHWVRLAELPDLIDRGLNGQLIIDKDLKQTYQDLIGRELGRQRRKVKEVATRVAGTYRDNAVLKVETDEDARFVEVPVAGERPKRYEIPELSMLSPGGLSLIQGRLLEVSEKSGLKIEQMYTEADFRSVIAIPLIALVGVFVAQVSVAWILGLAIPVALLRQSRSMRRRGTLELIDTLRASAGTPDMERITPMFAVCREQLGDIVKAIAAAAWSNGPSASEVGIDDDANHVFPRLAERLGLKRKVALDP